MRAEPFLSVLENKNNCMVTLLCSSYSGHHAWHDQPFSLKRSQVFVLMKRHSRISEKSFPGLWMPYVRTNLLPEKVLVSNFGTGDHAWHDQPFGIWHMPHCPSWPDNISSTKCEPAHSISMFHACTILGTDCNLIQRKYLKIFEFSHSGK